MKAIRGVPQWLTIDHELGWRDETIKIYSDSTIMQEERQDEKKKSTGKVAQSALMSTRPLGFPVGESKE